MDVEVAITQKGRIVNSGNFDFFPSIRLTYGEVCKFMLAQLTEVLEWV